MARLPGFQLYKWYCHLGLGNSSLCLCFPICKMGILTVPTCSEHNSWEMLRLGTDTCYESNQCWWFFSILRMFLSKKFNFSLDILLSGNIFFSIFLNFIGCLCHFSLFNSIVIEQGFLLLYLCILEPITMPSS